MKYFKLIALIILSILIVLGCSKKENNVQSTNYVEPNDFLSGKNYNELIIEVNYMKGYQPEQQALNNMVKLLEDRLNKPKGIKVISSEIPTLGKHSYNITDIEEIESIYRKSYPTFNKLTAYVLFVDGSYYLDNNDSKVLGVAYGSTSTVIFEETIQDFSGGITQPSKIVLETVVINHEFGHLLGLVNNGTPMTTDHQDAVHGRHCDNSNCLMYYTAETSDVVANLVGVGIPSFDANCIEDLRSNGGK